MKNHKMMRWALALTVALFAALILAPSSALADKKDCKDLPSQGDLTDALTAVVAAGGNGGLGNNMWGTIVDNKGTVCAVTNTGGASTNQWLGSRVISAQKANTANAFSLDIGSGGTVDTLSTANLWAPTQPGGSLFGLQFSNPVDTKTAYKGDPEKYGTKKDPMVGKKIGGVNVFGGGLALYNAAGVLLGALGVSGDTSCADHNIAWRTRDGLGLDFVPSGVSDLDTDNIIYLDSGETFDPGFAHPICGFGAAGLNPGIVAACPTGDGATAGC